MEQMFAKMLRPGVELRLLEERHAPALFARVNRERDRLREWMGWVDATRTEDDVLAFLRGELENFAASKGFSAGVWVDGTIGGLITLFRIDRVVYMGEIGYWLGREFQGRGIMTDAARAVTEHALVELELNRIQIRCAVGNVKSSAIPKRLGFTFEGILRQTSLVNGAYLDLEVYSMLRSEYRR